MDTEKPPVSDPQPVNLYEFAIAKARESATKRELPRVAEGAGVDYSWLSKFARGAIPGASYEKVDRLARWYMDQLPPPQLPLQQPGAAG